MPLLLKCITKHKQNYKCTYMHVHAYAFASCIRMHLDMHLDVITVETSN